MLDGILLYIFSIHEMVILLVIHVHVQLIGN